MLAWLRTQELRFACQRKQRLLFLFWPRPEDADGRRWACGGGELALCDGLLTCSSPGHLAHPARLPQVLALLHQGATSGPVEQRSAFSTARTLLLQELALAGHQQAGAGALAAAAAAAD